MKTFHIFFMVTIMSASLVSSDDSKCTEKPNITMKFKVQKLVRDKMPEMMGSQNVREFKYIMNDVEFNEKLKEKLLEESTEVKLAKNKEELVEELADVMEVINSLCKVNNITLEQVEKSRIEKHAKRGGFDNKIFLSHIEIKEDNPVIKYYKDRLSQYPEVE